MSRERTDDLEKEWVESGVTDGRLRLSTGAEEAGAGIPIPRGEIHKPVEVVNRFTARVWIGKGDNTSHKSNRSDKTTCLIGRQ